MAYVIEKEFEYKGLWCIVAMMDLGHRCGYVGVPKGHKYYGKDYEEIEEDIRCNGGLTFSSRDEHSDYPSKEHTDLWWFGWDYAHCWDANDWDAFEKNFDKEIVERIKLYRSFDFSNGEVSYIEDVEQECKKVVEQFLDDVECINDGKLKLDENNYYSADSNKAFISCSQVKDFMDCEAKALARLNGEYTEEKSIALWVGSYVDTALTETSEAMDKLLADNPKEFFCYGNPYKGLKADFKKADKMIERVKKDELMMKFLNGEHQVIMSGEINGVPTKIKIDSYIKDKAIVDLKTTQDMQKSVWSAEKGRYVSWIEGYKYTLQMAIYQEIVRQNTGKTLPCYLVVVDKTDVPDIGIFQIDNETMADELENIQDIVTNINAIKQGEIEPKRCEKCNYCKATKKAKILNWTEVFGEIGDDEE